MEREFGTTSDKYSIAYAWLPTKVKTHCTGIWHYKWIWFKHYSYQYVYYPQMTLPYKDKHLLKELR